MSIDGRTQRRIRPSSRVLRPRSNLKARVSLPEMEVDPNLDHVRYWLTSSSNHDCFFMVGLESGGVKERIGAIKIFLMGHSEVFRKMLNKSESALAEERDIRVPDCCPETFRNFLACVYGGTEIAVRKLKFEESVRVLYLCEKYLLTGVKHNISKCLLEVHNPLSTKDVMVCLLNPACLVNTNIADAISKVIQTNTDSIINNGQFKRLDINALVFIASQEKLSTNEINLWKSILIWWQNRISTGAASANSIKTTLQKVIGLIRFCTMDAGDFCKHVVPSGALSDIQISQVCQSIGTKTALEIQGINCEITSRYKYPGAEIEIVHILHPVSTFKNEEKSKSVPLNGFRWNILIKKAPSSSGNNYLGLFLQSSRPGNKPWRSCASAKLILVNQAGMSADRSIYFSDHWFDNNESDWGYDEFITWSDLLLPESGFVKNDSVKVRVEIEM